MYFSLPLPGLLRKTFFLWFGAIWLVLGVVLLGFGISATMGERRYQAEGRVVPGAVVSKFIERAKRDEKPTTEYLVAYRFTTESGQAVEGNASVSPQEWDQLEEGKPVQIRYLPHAPQSNRLAEKSTGGDAIVNLLLGLGVGALGGVLFTKGFRSARREVRLRRDGVTAQGTVLEIGPSWLAINRVRQMEVRYRYTDHMGQTHEGKSDPLSPDESDAWRPGETGTVRFDRKRPQESIWTGRTE